ncbi:MAG: hypothetical protein OEP95_12250, partial [Myxococcales bacterium]|nr:hypothetical protein [Myxococcales bacterium]
MTLGAVRFVELLSAAGGTFALAFIVALALGICALTLMFLCSAVVVLERFARAERRPLVVIAIAAAWSVLLAPLVLQEVRPELAAANWGDWWAAFGETALGVGVSIAVAVGIVAVLLRFVRDARLAAAAAVWLAAGYALLVGGVDRVGYAVAPALLMLALAAGL